MLAGTQHRLALIPAQASGGTVPLVARGAPARPRAARQQYGLLAIPVWHYNTPFTGVSTVRGSDDTTE